MLPLIQPPPHHQGMANPHLDPRFHNHHHHQQQQHHDYSPQHHHQGAPHHALAFRAAPSGAGAGTQNQNPYALGPLPPTPAPSAPRQSMSAHVAAAGPLMTTNSLPLGGLGSNSVFPIRSSQPTRDPSGLSRVQHVNQHEHQLRRKTPNGTIDAGYDGSPAQLATGPPPLKQIVLPGANLEHAHPPPLFAQPHADRWQQQPGLAPPVFSTNPDPMMPMFSAGRAPPPAPWQHRSSLDANFQNGSVVDHQTAHQAALPFNMPQYPYNATLKVAAPTPGMPYSYSHPTAFCHPTPPVWEAGIYAPTHPTVANRISMNGYDGGMYTHNPRPVMLNMGPPQRHPFALDPRPHITHGPEHAMAVQNNAVPQLHQQHQQPVLQAPDTGFDQSLGMQFANLQLPQDGTSRARFKEKVLAQAGKIYADLLSYLHASRKAMAKTGQNQGKPLSKLVVYPKPPKLASTRSRPRLAHALTDPSVHDYQPRHDNTAPGGLPHGLSPGEVGGGLQQDFHYGNQTVVPVTRAPAYPGYERSVGNPLANAKASVEMLTDLCEQSDWKWIDGILLGGCLYYGLEHYDEALEWFTRVVNLDPSHAEAISNVAATYYCLNHHTEAEQQWLKAVRLRPGYLEAVEHLVGLLGANQRSHDVVEIIDFVQKSLKIAGHGVFENPSSATSSKPPHFEPLSGSRDGRDQLAHGGAMAEPGFGSSGYSVSGDENGRILTLIHVKGNMLYALKDIDGASEAFEEAVLIGSGRPRRQGIQELIQQIQAVLSPQGHFSRQFSTPLLLPPETARQTAGLVFANNGDLPGLRHVPDGSSKRSAISTTSNSLLSLAKIFQDAVSSGNSLAGYSRQPSGVGDILSLYYLSLSLMESPSTANNVGILLASVQQPASSQSIASAMEMASTLPGIVPGSGLSLALAYYKYGLKLDPKHVHLHTNLGSLLKDIGQLDLAIQMYEQAVKCDPTFDIALTNLANAVKDRGRITEAIDYYKRAVQANPRFAEAVCGLSTALNSVCDWRGRGGVRLYEGRFDRWHVDEEGMIQDSLMQGATSGSGLMERVVGIVHRQLAEASKWGRDVLRGEDTLADFAYQLCRASGSSAGDPAQLASKLRSWVGKPWEGSKIVRMVERSTKMATRRWYLDKYVHGKESPEGYRRAQVPSALAVPSAPTVLPFHTFTCPLTAKAIRMISQRNALRISCSTLRSAWIPATVYPPPAPPRPHLNVGYISSDFNNHPLAHLMQSVFGMHNTARVKAFCYATTASDKSIHRKQIEQEAPMFRDVSSWSSDRLVDQIVQDGIHILVNLNGYTRGARNEIFAARPAPIQMSFMGFAGTLGAEWCDYLLADETAVPRSTLRPWRGNTTLSDVVRDEEDVEVDNWVYSENIIYCRDTFFCCDHAQSNDDQERQTTWEEEQRRRWEMRKELFPTLPNDAIILGNFNQLYKIDPTTFRTWLRILSNAPKAVLWLLRFPEVGESHLKRTARAWAGEEVASRILFTDVAPKQHHISRARVCDLFLDTPECNAHTTAADVLWSSTPLLTLPRYPYKMCSRMAASILKGALPKDSTGQQAAGELVADDEKEYEELAVRLVKSLSYIVPQGGYGSGSGRLWDLRKLLFEGKWKCGLFDTRRWVRDLEAAYEEAWRRWVAGEDGDIDL